MTAYKSFDNQKSALIQKSNTLKKAIEGDFDEIKEQSIEIGKKGLFVIGVLLIGFVAYKILSSKSKEVEVDNYGKDSTKIVYVNAGTSSSIFNEIMKHIALFLLNIARQKIVEYLQQTKNAE